MSTPNPKIPPASDRDFTSPAWQRFFNDLLRRVVDTGAIAWSLVNKAGSNITDIVTRNHADLQNINTASYTHLTATNHTDLTDAGDTTLHYHAADRSLANITGLGAGVGAFLATPSSANLAAALTDESSSGVVPFQELSTWTPVDSSGAGLSFTSVSGNYIRIGKLVIAHCSFTFPATANGSIVVIGGLPYASGSYGANSIHGFFVSTSTITSRGLYGGASSSTFGVDKNNGTAVAINSDFSGCLVYATVIYQTA